MQTLIENLSRGLNFSSVIFFILSANDLAFMVIYGLYPLVITIYFYRNVLNFKEKWFLNYWGEIMDNLSWRRESSAFYIAIFCYRRLLAALVVVLLADFPWAQITLTVYTNQLVITGIGLASPFKYRSDKWLELINEANIMICSYHMFCFTDFVPDALARS